MSLFRKKTVEPKVEWITGTPGLVETYPIVPARQALPQWFKDSATRTPNAATPPHGHRPPGAPEPPPPPPPGGTVGGAKTYDPDNKPTIRACPGMVDVMRSGYLLRAWTDIEITTPEPPRGPEDQFRSITAMAPNETGGKVGAFGPGLNQRLPLWPDEYAFALKFDSPWCCKTPPGWSLLYMPVPYAEKQPFRVLHGITDNDTFHVVNLVVMWSHHGRYLIEAGTPLCWLLPVRRDGFNMSTEVRYDPEYSTQLRALGKGGIGTNGGGRLIHGSYLRERAKNRKR